jgi:L-iditol 2-dehydrogenase
MNAVEFLGGERLEVVSRPDPTPGPGELLIAPTAVGICGTDVEIFEGSLVYFREGWAKFPIVPGHEWVGDVVEVGQGVRGFSPGDQVTGETPLGCGVCSRCRAGAYHLCALRTETGILNRDGAMATRMVFPAAAAHDARGIPSRAAALVEPASVALNGVRRAGASGRNVLIVGAGTIGLLAAQCARAEGAASVRVAEAREDRLALAARMGFPRHDPAGGPAGVAIVGGPEGPGGIAAPASGDIAAPATGGIAAPATGDITAPAGEDAYDVAIVCAGGAGALSFALRTVRPGGSVAVLGLSGAEAIPVDMDSVVVRDVTVHGVLGSPHVWPDAIALVRSGVVDTAPLVSATYALAQARDALETLTRPGSLKVLIEPAAG